MFDFMIRKMVVLLQAYELLEIFYGPSTMDGTELMIVQATMIRNQENGVFCSGNTKNDADQISKFLMTNEYNILIYSSRNQNRLIPIAVREEGRSEAVAKTGSAKQ